MCDEYAIQQGENSLTWQIGRIATIDSNKPSAAVPVARCKAIMALWRRGGGDSVATRLRCRVVRSGALSGGVKTPADEADGAETWLTSALLAPGGVHGARTNARSGTAREDVHSRYCPQLNGRSTSGGGSSSTPFLAHHPTGLMRLACSVTDMSTQ